MDKVDGETKLDGPYAAAKKELLTLTTALDAVPQTSKSFVIVERNRLLPVTVATKDETNLFDIENTIDTFRHYVYFFAPLAHFSTPAPPTHTQSPTTAHPRACARAFAFVFVLLLLRLSRKGSQEGWQGVEGVAL